jgi:hypothetical protein
MKLVFYERQQSVLTVVAARHRAMAHLTRHSNSMIHPSCKGTKSFWVLGFLVDQNSWASNPKGSYYWSAPLEHYSASVTLMHN